MNKARANLAGLFQTKKTLATVRAYSGKKQKEQSILCANSPSSRLHSI